MLSRAGLMVAAALSLLALVRLHDRPAPPADAPRAGLEPEGLRDAANESDSSALLQEARQRAGTDGGSMEGRDVTAVPGVGHATPAFGRGDYNIWSKNCHTAANWFTAVATYERIEAGILVCRGNPETNAAFHTPNWALPHPGRACVYNWGAEPCCWHDAASPPDVSSGEGLRCARGACGDQYDARQTRALPAGKLVEWPGPTVCTVMLAGGPPSMPQGIAEDALTERQMTGAAEVRVPPRPNLPEGARLDFSPELQPACLRCCEDRARLWSAEEWGQGRQEQFRMQCSGVCVAAFRKRRE